MRNIWKLFLHDLKRLTPNVVTGIIVVGLVLIPSIFSWYNIIACWDVFDNTGNLKVAVANTDEGYESELVPLRVNIGEQVVSELRANHQLDWTFTTAEDAVDGAKSGAYYAAVVIPASFSRDMMTFYSDDVEHGKIIYYTNEKKSAVAPKVTDQGADGVAHQINEVFTKTLSEVGLSVATALSDYADDPDVNSRIGRVAKQVEGMGTSMTQAASVLGSYASLLDSAQQLVGSSSELLGQAKDGAARIGEEAGGAREAARTIGDAMDDAAGALASAIQSSSAGYAGLADAVDAAFASTDTLTGDVSAQLRAQALAVDGHIEHYRTIIAQLEQLEDQMPDKYRPAAEALVAQMNAALGLQEQLRDSLTSAADGIESGNAGAQAGHAEITQLAEQASQSVSGLASSYESDVKPGLAQLEDEVSSLVSSLSASASVLDGVGGELSGAADSVAGQLGAAKQKLLDAAAELDASAGQFSALAEAIMGALSSGDVDELRRVLGSDPASLAAALAAPVQLDRQAVFPADNFGSQMAPLYTTLAIWIGSLLLLVALKSTVSQRARDELDNPKLHQLFLGRFGVFAVLSLLQTTCVAVGNMAFLGVQANNPLLYLVCFWVAGLVFTFIIYTLVVSFANLGKAIAVLLLIVQVSGGGGSFPLQLLPEFFQAVSPYLPATHVINAMRAAMMGVYHNDFWIEIGTLVLFAVPFALLGLLLRKPLMKFLDWYVEKVEDSKLVA